MKLKLGVALLALVSAVIIPSSLFADSDALPQAAPLRPASEAGSHDAARAYRSLPLHFEPTSDEGRFLGRSGGYSVLIGAGDSAIGIPGAKAGPMRVLHFTFDHANAAAQLEPIEPLPGVANYYVGQDPSKWRLGVRTFAKLRTKDVYPGVDVVYYGDHRRLEFDFVVAPMANAKAIALTLSGMDKLYVNGDGDLVAEVNGQPVRFAKPYAYQKVAGLTKRVSAEYALSAPNKAELKLGEYDKNLELVIDPVMSYSTYLGGSQGDTANGIAVDTNGNAYITGQTCSIGKDANPVVFPSGNPNTTNTSPEGVLGACDAYVTKLNAAGSTVLFTTFISGVAPTPAGASATGNGITLDNVALNPSPVPNGYPNLYVVGTTSFSDMPIPICHTLPCTVGYYADATHPSISPDFPGGDTDPFIAILDSQTGTLIRTTYLGGNGTDAGYAIAVDPQQNVVVSGKTSSFNFPAYNGFEPITEAYVGFVTKLDFGLHISPPILPGASPMSPRTASYADSCGTTCPATPDPTKAYFFFSAVYGGQLVAPPQTWAYADGTQITSGTITTVTPYCATTIPPQTYPALRIVALNGGTTGATGINWVADNLCSNGVVGNLIPDNGITWEVLGILPLPETLSASTEAYGVALDANGDVFAVGGSSTTELHPSLPGPGYTSGGYDWLPQADTYYLGTGSWIIKLHGHDTATGSMNAGWPVYVTALETNMTDHTSFVDAARAVAVDSQGDAYVVGTATGSLLSAVGLNESPLGSAPTTDAYILKLITPSQIDYATYLGGSGNDQGLAVAIDAGGFAYVAGSTASTNIPVINAIYDANGNPMQQLKGTTYQEAYLVKVTPDGTGLEMSAYLGGSQGDQANAIALSPSGNGDIYLAGNTNSSDFPLQPLAPATPVPGLSAYAKNGDAFVTKIEGASFPMVSITPTNQTLTFADQVVGFSSTTTLPVVLTSTGMVPLKISSIAPSGDFTQTNNCNVPTGLPPATNSQNTCTITVTFTPSAVGTRQGTLTIIDDATNNPSPQVIGLTGNGVLVQDSVTTNPATTPPTLTFPATTVGTTSAPLYVTVKNTDSAQTLILSSFVPSGNYSISSNTCNTLLTPGQYCTIGVVFTPTLPGQASGNTASLIINGNGNNMPATVTLTGIGSGAGSTGGTTTTPGFTMTPTTQSMAITGGKATVGVTLTAVNGFSQSVSLTCTGQGGASCSPPTATTFVNTASAPTISFTVSVGGGGGITVGQLMRPGRLLACLLPFGGIGLVLVGRRKRWLLLLGLAVWLALGMAACGGGGSNSSSAAQPSVTVTATSQDGSATQAATYYLNKS